MNEETLPSPAPVIPAVEDKLRSVLGAVTEAVMALLSTDAPERFGRASRLCVMGQKLSIELVTSVRDAKKIRHDEAAQLRLANGLGPEGQYIAEGDGDVVGYVDDQQDYAILNPDGRGDYFPPLHLGALPRPDDAATLQRDMITLVAQWFEEQKRDKGKKKEKDPSEARYELYTELNQLLRTREDLQAPADAPLLATVEKKIRIYIDLIAKDDSPHDPAAPDTDVVSAELLRGHPPRAGEQWGDAGRDRGPVLHREGRAPDAPGGGDAERAPEIAVG